MPVPDYQSLMLPALEALSGGVEVPLSKVRERVAAAEGLTAEDMRELFSRSHQTIFTNRVSWAVIYMQRAGLVEKVRRGVYRLTAEGERVLAQAHPRIDNEFLGRYPAFVKWRAMSNVRKQNKGIAVPGPPDNIADTPEEALDRVIQQLRDTLEAEVLDRVREAPPKFLEQVVVDLLIAMGYGGGDAAMGRGDRAFGRRRD